LPCVSDRVSDRDLDTPRKPLIDIFEIDVIDVLKTLLWWGLTLVGFIAVPPTRGACHRLAFFMFHRFVGVGGSDEPVLSCLGVRSIRERFLVCGFGLVVTLTPPPARGLATSPERNRGRIFRGLRESVQDFVGLVVGRRVYRGILVSSGDEAGARREAGVGTGVPTYPETHLHPTSVSRCLGGDVFRCVFGFGVRAVGFGRAAKDLVSAAKELCRATKELVSATKELCSATK
jgi:hypothetical protein